MYLLLITFVLMVCSLSWADKIEKVDSKTVQITKSAPVEVVDFETASSKVNHLKQAKANADAASVQYQAEIDALLGAFSSAGLNWSDLEVLKKNEKDN